MSFLLLILTLHINYVNEDIYKAHFKSQNILKNNVNVKYIT